MLMNVGFIGSGQGGGNIVNTFAKKHDNVMVVNTAITDMEKLENINNDLKVLTSIGNGGGAGKDPALGEKALLIPENKEKVREKIDINLNKCDLIWIVVGLGGGTGSLGAVQLIQLLTEMGKEHGIICTLPTGEDCVQRRNALISLEKITTALELSDTFNPVIVIDNDYLKTTAKEEMEKGNFEGILDKANQYIFDNINKIGEYAERASSSRSFDPQDFRNQFKETGTIQISSCDIPIDNLSDKGLYSAVTESWKENKMYLTGDLDTMTGMTLIVEKPKGIDDKDLIDNLFKEAKRKNTGVNICEGIYDADGNRGFLGIGKSGESIIRVHTLLTGIEFPDLSEFREHTINEYKLYMQKRNKNKNFALGLNLDELGIGNEKKNKGQKIDLAVYNKDMEFADEDEVKNKKMDWTRLKEFDNAN